MLQLTGAAVVPTVLGCVPASLGGSAALCSLFLCSPQHLCASTPLLMLRLFSGP